MSIMTSWYIAVISIAISLSSYFVIHFHSTRNIKIQENIQQTRGAYEAEMHNLIHEVEFSIQYKITNTNISTYHSMRSVAWDARKKSVLLEMFTTFTSDSIGNLLRMAIPYFLLPLQTTGALTMGKIY